MASLEKALANNQIAMNALKEEVVETKKAKEQQEAPQGAMMPQQGMNPPMMAEGSRGSSTWSIFYKHIEKEDRILKIGGIE